MVANVALIWQASFWLNLSAISFLTTLDTVTLKNFSKFLTIHFKLFKNLYTSKNFSTISTLSYSKVLDKHSKNSLAKWGHSIAT